MYTRFALVSTFCAFFFLGTNPAMAQSPCPKLSMYGTIKPVDKPLVCTLPELYGPNGLFFGDFNGGSLVAPGEGGQIVPAGNLFSINESVATQIALLPLVAPAAGISLTFDKSLGIYLVSNDSFGPIFSERASTIGRNRLAIGFSYQYMSFDSIDGVNLGSFPTVFIQNVNLNGNPCNPLQQNNSCGNINYDYINASNRINLKINQYTAFATFGLSKHIDLSVAVPVLTVSMAAAANSSWVYNSGTPSGGGGLGFGATAQPGFPGSNGVCLAGPSGPPPTSLNPPSATCVQALYSNSGSSSGIGDVTTRLKATLKTWEHSGLAAGVDVRLPTGDEKNFLGTGAIGVKPFAIWSLTGRFSPHVNLGYEWNGKTILAGDVVTGTKANLPGEFLYSAGIEAGVYRSLTATFDLLGQAIFNGSRIQLVNTQVPGICPIDPTGFQNCKLALPPGQQTTVEGTRGTYAIDNASIGLRYRPFGKFLISGSVLLKLDDGGLRSKAIPMVSAIYTFR
jgi:hypothetical protein